MVIVHRKPIRPLSGLMPGLLQQYHDNITLENEKNLLKYADYPKITAIVIGRGLRDCKTRSFRKFNCSLAKCAARDA